MELVCLEEEGRVRYFTSAHSTGPARVTDVLLKKHVLSIRPAFSPTT